MNRRRILLVCLCAMGLTSGFGSAALASHYVYLGTLNLRTSPAHEGDFTGFAEFYAQGTGHGGFHVGGSICDRMQDGNGVYGQGRVEGYGWASPLGDSDGAGPNCAQEDREFYDPQALWVNSGQYQVCVDDFGPDTCGVSQWYYRH